MYRNYRAVAHPVDTIHIFVESIRDRISRGEDPRKLPDKQVCVEFWV